MKRPKPRLKLPVLPSFNPKDWKSVHAAFAGLPRWPFQQAWLPKPQAELRPAFAGAAFHRNALIVYAELHDENIFNPARKFNEEAYTQGDTFEIFLRPRQQTAYYELHVTPDNCVFQLRFPSASFIQELRQGKHGGGIQSLKLRRRIFESWTQVYPDLMRWYVLARIPMANVVEKKPAASPQQWLLSLSRYDYPKPKGTPILSSTSPHPQCNYHRQSEWGTVIFPS